jgi:hypothetical protein
MLKIVFGASLRKLLELEMISPFRNLFTARGRGQCSIILEKIM